MMKFLFLLLSLVLSYTYAKVDACREPTQVHELYSKFHGEETCDRVSYTARRNSLERTATIRRFQEQPGSYNAVPNERTVVCPTIVHAFPPKQVVGLDKAGLSKTRHRLRLFCLGSIMMAWKYRRGIIPSLLKMILKPY
jgi:hypothetical protein